MSRVCLGLVWLSSRFINRAAAFRYASLGLATLLGGSLIPVGSDVLAPAAQASAAVAKLGPIASTLPTSTPHVKGRMLRAYKKAGGKARLGRPNANAKCGLPERACLQHFSKGTMYLQRNGRSWVTKAGGVRGELLLVTRSQVGKRQKVVNGRKQVTKYSRYVRGGPYLWCTHLLSWTSWASGNGTLLPRVAAASSFKAYAKANWKASKTPKRGTYVLMNGRTGTSNHMVLVWMVKPGKRSITIIEGNWGKKVNMRTVPRTRNMVFYDPL